MKRIVLLLFVTLGVSAQTRIASDFEIAQMKEQIARSTSFSAQISGHLNLGDLYATREDRTTAVREYRTALDIATKQRTDARLDSDLTRYGTATSMAALANAKLGNGSAAFELAEEAGRYASDSADFWNIYASAMSVLGRHAKAAGAARNAVAIASAQLERQPSVARRLDLGVNQYALASALIASGETAQAERLLREIISSLGGSAFDALRRDVARSESFEINSTTRGDAAAYLSLLNRAQLRLASSLERRGEKSEARGVYRRVLESRTDDATALAGIARLSQNETDFAEAFEANPFTLGLVREYQRFLSKATPSEPEAETTGSTVRKALGQMHRNEMRAARATLDGLLAKFPENETLRTLRRETEVNAAVPAFLSGGKLEAGDLRNLLSLLGDEKLTPEQLAALDRAELQSTVTFDTATAAESTTIFASGIVDGVPFRFSEPTAFNGTFVPNSPLRLTYRILGASGDALLLEPVRLEAAP